MTKVNEQKPTAEAVRVAEEAHKLIIYELRPGRFECHCCGMVSTLNEPRKHSEECPFHAIATALAARDAEIERLRDFMEEDFIPASAIGEFQEAVRKLVLEESGAPDSLIDGKGTDAGWEEFTLCEIAQGFHYMQEQNEKQRALLVELATVLKEVRDVDESAIQAMEKDFGILPTDCTLINKVKEAISNPAVVELLKGVK